MDGGSIWNLPVVDWALGPLAFFLALGNPHCLAGFRGDLDQWSFGASGRPGLPGQSKHTGTPGSLSGMPSLPDDFLFQAHTWPWPAFSEVISMDGGSCP